MPAPWWLSGKESSCNAGGVGLILGQEDPLEKEMATHSWLGNPMVRGAWLACSHGVSKELDTT